MQLTLSEIADFVNGTVIGDGGIVISGVSEIQNGISGTITFLSNPIYKKYLSSTAAAAIFVDDKKLLNGKNGILVSNPQLAIAKILESFSPRKKKSPTIDSKAIISKFIANERNKFDTRFNYNLFKWGMVQYVTIKELTTKRYTTKYKWHFYRTPFIKFCN